MFSEISFISLLFSFLYTYFTSGLGFIIAVCMTVYLFGGWTHSYIEKIEPKGWRLYTVQTVVVVVILAIIVAVGFIAVNYIPDAWRENENRAVQNYYERRVYELQHDGMSESDAQRTVFRELLEHYDLPKIYEEERQKSSYR